MASPIDGVPREPDPGDFVQPQAVWYEAPDGITYRVHAAAAAPDGQTIFADPIPPRTSLTSRMFEAPDGRWRVYHFADDEPRDIDVASLNRQFTASQPSDGLRIRPYALVWYLPTPDGLTDLGVWRRFVNEEMREELRRHTRPIYDFQSIISAFRILERNHAEMLDTLREQNAGFDRAAWSETMGPVPIESVIAVVQRISNFLGATSAFLDITSRQLERSFGESSSEFMSWDSKRTALYAARVEYRILYHLRHFAQHGALPLSSLTVRGEREGNVLTMTHTTVAEISRDKLLADKFKWKADVKADLQRRTANFDLLPLAETYLDCLRRLCIEAARLFAPQLAASRAYLESLSASVGVPEGAVLVLHGPEPSTPQPLDVVMDGLIIPTEKLAWQTDTIARLEAECSVA